MKKKFLQCGMIFISESVLKSLVFLFGLITFHTMVIFLNFQIGNQKLYKKIKNYIKKTSNLLIIG